nr:immunoglobulin light chain junction region [Macaca mulatta]MOV80200.1 immunoglobulin light chain junction region [Macaca mulatta]
CLQYNSGPWTF